MGKTKTAFVGGVTEDKVSGSDKYAEKMKKKAIAEGNFVKVEQPKVEEVKKEVTEDQDREKGQTTDYRLQTTEKLKNEEIEGKVNIKNKTHKKAGEEKVHIAGLKGGQRIKVIGEEIPEQTIEEKITESTENISEGAEIKKQRKAKVRSKKFVSMKAKVDRNKLFSINEAIKLVRETNITKFDATLELHITTKKSPMNANVVLPHSFGKTKKIEVATDETIKKLETGKADFDVLLATSDMMPKLVPFAKILGPKGLMPNPKNGTIIKSLEDAKKFSADSMSLKTQKDASVIHTTAGKLSQSDSELEENIKAVIAAIDPKMIVRLFIKSTMSPSVKVKI